jgi:hypothetical protein
MSATKTQTAADTIVALDLGKFKCDRLRSLRNPRQGRAERRKPSDSRRRPHAGGCVGPISSGCLAPYH